MISLQDIKDQRVLITGSSTGIGAAAALGFAALGAKVAVHYNRSKAEAEKVVAAITEAGGTAVLVGGDVTDRDAAAAIVSNAVNELGGLDCLINNAGAMVQRTRLAEFTDDIYEGVTDLNIRSVLTVTREAIPSLRKASHASIINVGSIAGRNGGAPGSGIYAASKAAVHSLTRGMAREFAPEGIRVNAVAPGVIETPFHNATPKDILASMLATIPLGRLGAQHECTGAFLFLASPSMAGYITGQIIDVNGGQFMP